MGEIRCRRGALALALAVGVAACNVRIADVPALDAGGSTSETAGGETSGSAGPDDGGGADPGANEVLVRGGDGGDEEVAPEPDGEEDFGPPAPEPLLPSENACTNTPDVEALSLHDAEQVAGECFKGGCNAEMDFLGCMLACTTEATGLSEPCATCFVLGAACVIEHCFFVCADEEHTEDCDACLGGACIPPLESCTGIPVEDLPKPAPPDDPPGACASAADLQVFDAGGIGQVTFECLDVCEDQPDLEVCVALCVGGVFPVSDGCAACVAGHAACALAECGTKCKGAPGQEAAQEAVCKSCALATCGDAFLACAGLAFPEPGDSLPAALACAGPEAGALLDSEVGLAAPGCGLSCWGGAPGCTAACLEGETGLAPACAACAGAAVDCVLAGCDLHCEEDPLSELCSGCVASKCGPAWTECSGVEALFAFVPPVPPPEGECGETDQKLLLAKDPAKTAFECVETCTGAPDPVYCATPCITSKTGLTQACGGCVAARGVCTVDLCGGACPGAASLGEPACADCVEASCEEAYEACAFGAPAP